MAQTVDEIAELLNKMREDNERSKDTIEKTLTSIDNRLEFIEDDDEAEELIKMYIADLKKSVDNKYSDATVKLEKIKSHFDEILNKQADVALRKDVESLSETFFLNTSAITSDLAEQKKALEYLKGHLIEIQESSYNKGEIENLFKEFKKNLISLNSGIDKALGQTVDVLRNINITDTINEINGNFSNISLEIKKVPAQIAKNDERFRQMLSLLNEKVDVIATYSSNSEILDDLNEQVTEITSALETLKSFISETYDSTDNYFREKFSQLENEFSSIVTDSDFSKFRTDLGDFVQKIIDNSAALNSELSYSTERIESILTTVKALDFRDDFENIVSRIIELRDAFEEGLQLNHQNIASSIIELSKKFNDSYEKQDERRREIYSDLKNDLESITEILKNISGDNLTEIVNTLEDKTNKISEIVSSINENSDNNYNRIINNFDDIKENIGQVSSDISDLQVEFKNTANENSDRIISEISDIKNTAHENSDKIISEISNITNVINENNEPSEKLLWEISNISSEVNGLRDEFRQSSAADFQNSSKIVDEIYNISDRIVDLRTTINETPNFDIDEVKHLIEDLSEKLSNDLARQRELFTNQSSDIEKLESLNTLFEDIKNIENVLHEQSDLFKNSLDNNIAGIRNYIDEINDKLNSSGFEIGNLQNIPEDIKNLEQTLEQQTQSIQTSVVEANDSIKNYIGEIRYLIESNDNSAENFQAINENIHSLENILIQQSNGLQNSISEHIAELKENFSEINSSFENSRLENYEKISAKLNEIEELNRSYETSVSTLNVSLAEVLQSISNTRENNTELNNSVNNVVDSINHLISRINDEENRYSEVSSVITALLEMTAKKEDIADIDKRLDSFDYTENLQQISDRIDTLSSIFETSSRTNFENLSEKIGGISQVISDFQNVLENQTEINSLNLTNHFEKFREDLSNILTVDDFAVFKTNFEEFVQNIINNTDIANANSEAVKDEIAKLFEKLDNMSFSEGFQDVNNNIASINLTIDNLASEVRTLSDLSTQKYSEVLDNISFELQKTAGEISDKISSDNELNFGDIKGNIDNISSQIFDLKNDLTNSHDSSLFALSARFDNLKTNFEDITNSINSLSSLFENKSDNNVNQIIDNIREITAHVEELKYELSQSDYVNKILDTVNELSLKVDNLADNEELKEKISSIKDAVTLLSSDIKMSQEEYSDILRVNNEEQLNNLSNISANVESIKYHIDDTVESLRNYIEELDNISKTSNAMTENTVSEKLMDLQTILSDNSNLFEQKFTDLGIKLQEFAHIVENSNSDTEGKISASLDEISAIKDELLSLDNILKSFKLSNDEKLNETTSVLDAGIENIVYSINSINDNINNGVENSLKDGIASLDEKFAEISGILTNIKEEFSYNDAFVDISDKVLSLRDEMKLISTDIMHISEMKAEEIISAFEPVKEVMKEFTNFEFDKVISDLKSQIELSFMNLGADVNGEIASNGESLNRLEQAYKETYEKISSIEECVSEKFREEIELLNTTFEKGIVDLRYGFEDKFEDKINDIKAYFDIAFNDSKIYDSIDSFKNNLDEIDDRIQNSISSVKTDLDEINTKLDIAVANSNQNALQESLQLKFNDLTDSNNQINEKLDILALNDNNEELQSRFDDLEDCIDDYSEHISAQIASIDDKIDVLVADNANEETQLRFDEMLELHNKISEILSTLNEKVTTIANDDTKTEIVAEISSIKNILFEQKKFFEDNTNEKYSEIDTYLKDVLSKLDSVDIDKNTEDIKDSVMQAIVSLTDQISFIEETEEIKDFVEEKTDKLNEKITEVQKQLKQLTSPDDDFNYTYTLQDVESDIARLRMSINNMSNSDFDDLNDEIKKITNSIENLESSLTQEQITDLKDDIEKLSEEIVSISSRTNKLLLNSDESYKALNDGLNSFSDTIYKLEDRINYLDNTEINERLERKIDNIQSLASASTNADKVFHQAMMYLGEWVDATTESISSVSDKISQIQDYKNLIPNKNDIVNDVVSDIKDYTDGTVFGTIREMIPDNKEIIDSLEEKFNNQEELIDSLDQKITNQKERIENLENKIEQILSILEEKDDMILNRKVDKIEKMLSGLNANIEKLTSYVEE